MLLDIILPPLPPNPPPTDVFVAVTVVGLLTVFALLLCVYTHVSRGTD